MEKGTLNSVAEGAQSSAEERAQSSEEEDGVVATEPLVASEPPPNFCETFWGWLGLGPPQPKGKGKGKGKKGKGKGPPPVEEESVEDLFQPPQFGEPDPQAPAAPAAPATQAEPPAQEAPAVQEAPAAEEALAAQEAPAAEEAPAAKEAPTAEVAPAAMEALPQNVFRVPELEQLVTLLCTVTSGKDMPSVNLLGGCDPFVEARLVEGDVTASKMENVPNGPIQTNIFEGQGDPVWNKRLELKNAAFSPDWHVQLILWDYNLTGNQPCGQASLPLPDCLTNCSYKPHARKKDVSENKQQIDIKGTGCKRTTIDVKFSYWEQHEITCEVVKGTRLPLMDMMGTIDAFVEVRLVQGDLTKKPLNRTAGEESFWQGQTKVVNNSQDPKWNHTFDIISHGDPDLHLLVILWDDDSPLPATATGVATIPLKDVVISDPGTASDHKLKLNQAPGEEKVADLKKSSLLVKLKWNIVMK